MTSAVQTRPKRPRRAEITADEIAQIRADYAAGITMHQIARDYRRSLHTVKAHIADLVHPTAPPTVEVAPDNLNAATWEGRAACRGVDVNVFFPNHKNDAGIAHAKRYCKRCPVRAECLDWAVRTHSSEGVFGGMYFGLNSRRGAA